MTAFDDFYSTHINAIFTYCKYRVKDYQEAQDLTADTFVKFMQAKGLSKPNPVAYLYTICKHLIIDYYRHHSHPSTTLDCIVDQIPDPHLENENFCNRLDLVRLLESLDSIAKEAVLLKYVQDLDLKTVSHLIGKSESATKSIIYRSLNKMKLQAASEGVDYA